MSNPQSRVWDRETTLVAQLAAAASLFSFLFYFRNGDLLLYGDAVAHINIARRVIDSQTPGLLQLGTVWLPLPHLLMIPFLFSDAAWRTGVAGSLPSMCAYVLGTAGIFRLIRGSLSSAEQPDIPARTAAWMAAAIYAANPNLLYLQATAMTELLCSAFFIWTIVHFAEFVRAVDAHNRQPANSALFKCGLCLAAAALTRYDGWFLAGVVCVAVACVIVISGRQSELRREFAKFILLAVAAPVFWLGYNAAIYRNPLEFANGPYSARAIEQKTALSGNEPYPGWHNLRVSFSYSLKAAEDNVGEGKAQKCWVLLLVIGAAIACLRRKLWPLLVVLLPLAFYTLSVAYGSVAIFLPEWWPFSYYNVRFGTEAIPAFAVMAAIVLHFAFIRASSKQMKAAAIVAMLVVAGGNYAWIWRSQPICFREAWANSRTRIAFERALATNLLMLPHDSIFLMYLGDHVGALQDAGIPLRQVINEGNHRPWKTPVDADGLWERALADPKRYADYVVAIDQDPVAQRVQKHDLSSVVVVHSEGQPPATIYWTHRPPR
jgi:hypothetical protein